jgi:hypothetical protein
MEYHNGVQGWLLNAYGAEVKPSYYMPIVMLEKMGVSDPECDEISGRACTAAALKNLHSQSGWHPDLVVHRVLDVIPPEYKNPVV